MILNVPKKKNCPSRSVGPLLSNSNYLPNLPRLNLLVDSRLFVFLCVYALAFAFGAFGFGAVVCEFRSGNASCLFFRLVNFVRDLSRGNFRFRITGLGNWTYEFGGAASGFIFRES